VRTRLLALGGVLFVLIGGLVLRQPEVESSSGAPNVLFVVLDTTRADRMSVHGYERPTTPFLEELAETSVVFEQARSPGIWTLPAHASMFTGLPASSTGADERWLWLDSYHLTLAEHLKSGGYDTVAVAANALLSKDTNLLQGFDAIVNPWHPKLKTMAAKRTADKLLPDDRSNELSPHYAPPEHGARNAEWARAAYKESGPLLVNALLRWVDRRPDERPWFAFVNIMEAHTPRVPSLESRKAVMDDATIALGLQTDQSHIAFHFYNFGKQDYTDEELRAIGGVYDASLRDLDGVMRTLVEGLSARGVLDDTVLVITSDHGENLGDHHLFNHRFALWDSLLHVPLMVRYPSRLAPDRVARPVSTGDLFGTIASLTGTPLPLGHTYGDLFAAEPVPVVSEMALPLEREVRTVMEVHPDVELAPWMRSGRSLVRGSDKWIMWDQGVLERYQLAEDPGELHDVVGDDATQDAASVAWLEGWQQRAPEYDTSRRGPGDQPKHVRASQEELRRQLEALGYIQDGQ